MDVRVKFLGGAGTVTGSKYLVQIGDFNLLVDCGLFQGLKDLRLRNWENLPIEDSNIDAVVLTHAHLDHSGYLPRLVKEGFNGPIFCTHATADLLKLLLLDSAKLQEEEADFARKKGYSKHDNPQPLYNTHDVEAALPLVKSYPFNKVHQINGRLGVKFHYAGHILGASSVEIIIQGNNQEKRLVFSGDIGRQNDPILYPPKTPPKADVLFVESTYGDRFNNDENVKSELASLIRQAIDRNGCLLIPAFSVGRTQNLLMHIKDLMTAGTIPELEVFMDSPMAISATEIYLRHMDDHKLTEEMVASEESFLTLRKNLITVRSREASVYLNNKKSGAIILSASGMMSGGRILHHLFHRLPNKNDTLLIAGYQAEGTRGRRILEGEESVRIFGQNVPVNCHVEVIHGLSAHADQAELFTWLGGIQHSPKMTFVVHGEEESAKVMRQKIEDDLGWNAFVPKYLEAVKLFSGI